MFAISLVRFQLSGFDPLVCRSWPREPIKLHVEFCKEPGQKRPPGVVGRPNEDVVGDILGARPKVPF